MMSSQRILGVMLLLISATSLSAQISFTSAITLALQNSPRVKVAQDDVNRALAALAETKDVFIPVVGVAGGVGRAYGITLNIPTIFTASAQSLIYSSSQRSYIRAARQSLQSSNMTLADIRQQVEEDAAITYLSLDQAELRSQVIAQEYGFALRLVSITQDRVTAGIENGLNLKRARRTAVQTRLQQLQLEDEIASLREHLTEIMGVPAMALATVPESIPTESSFSASYDSPFLVTKTLSMLSAEANARAKFEQALGDSHYTMRPQVSFQAQYGRISPINDVSSYYNLNGKYNTFEAGVAIQLAFLDRGRVARSRGTMAEAMRAQHEVQVLRTQQTEDRLRQQHALLELASRAELAELDQGIAQDQLDAVLVEVRSRSDTVAGRQMTPKDEQNARLEERQRYLDVLDATLQLRKAHIFYLRQTGVLDTWLKSLAKN